MATKTKKQTKAKTKPSKHTPKPREEQMPLDVNSIDINNLTDRDLAYMEQIAELGQIELSKQHYYDYVKYVHSDIYRYTRHGEFICNILDDAIKEREKMFRGEIPKRTQYLMFNMPAQHGKSLHITETFPSYFLGKFPNHGCIEISYNEDFAQKFGGANRDKVVEFGSKIFGVDVNKDTSSKTEWSIKNKETGKKYRGGMISRGIGSGITGSSWGDLIIIDDPIKNKQDAESPSRRQTIWNEWDASISKRIHKGAIVILVQTRWHEDDLQGRLENESYAKVRPWEKYNLTLEAEENDILGRSIGEPLWPEEYGYDFIEQEKSSPQTFSAMCQGRPTSEKGNMFKRYWWKFWKPKGMDLPPITLKDENDEYFTVEAKNIPDDIPYKLQSWDMTFKNTDGTDMVCGQVWGTHFANCYLLDCMNERMDFVQTCKAVLALSQKHPTAVTKLVEEKANGAAVISMLRNKVPGFIPIVPKESKVARASAVTDMVEAGNVWLPHPDLFPWVNEFIEQHAAFPKAPNDDMVDAGSQALHRLMYTVNIVGGEGQKEQLPRGFDYEVEIEDDEEETIYDM